MALLGLTSAQAKLAKWLIRRAGEAIPPALAWLSTDLVANAEAPTTLEWRRFTLDWTRLTPTGTTEDRAQFKLDLLNVTADELDVTWTSGDYAAVRARFATFCTAMIPSIANSQTWGDLKAYRMQFNDVPDVLRPFKDTGPPQYKSTIGGTGTQGLTVAYQLAPTVTFRTAWARHWGRIYLPTCAGATFTTDGRLNSSYRAAVISAVNTLLSGLHDDGFYPVVPVGQLDKAPFHALLGMTLATMDDVPDVQRRRRPRQVAARS